MTTASTILVILLTLILCCPVIANLAVKDRFDIFKPAVFFSFLMLLCYAYPAYGFIQGTDAFTTSWDSTPPRESAIEGALGVAIVAVLSFYYGYYRRPAARHSKMKAAPEPEHQGVSDPIRLRRVVTSYTLLGSGLFLIGVHFVGGFAVLSSSLGDRIRTFAGLNYLIGGVNLMLSASLVWWVSLLRSRRVKNWRFWSYSTAALCVNTMQGNKSTLFIFVVTMAILYHVMYRPIRPTKVILSAVVLFVALTAYGRVAREYFAVGEFTTIDSQNITRSDLSEVVASEIGGNFLQLQVLTTIIDRMPKELPYQNGKTLLSLFTMPVPRVLWLDKLLPAPGVLTVAFWPEKFLNEGASMPPGLVGEFYMNFGAIGVAAGMFLFGVTYARLETRVREKPTNTVLVTFYGLIVAMMLHYLRGEFVSPTVTLLILGIPIWIAERYVFRPGGVRRMPAVSSGLLKSQELCR
jgi:oligosaccharide repeat unit polymerase